MQNKKQKVYKQMENEKSKEINSIKVRKLLMNNARLKFKKEREKLRENAQSPSKFIERKIGSKYDKNYNFFDHK